MTDYTQNHHLEIVSEKVVQSASKGRNQWLFLKKFDGKRVIDFVEAANLATRYAPPDTYQVGSWWYRELDYCRKKGVIRIVESDTLPLKVPWGGNDDNATFQERSPEASTPLNHAVVTPSILSESGLYLVILNNEDPISANAHDDRVAHTSIQVDRKNCKFGKAKNLKRRRENYYKTFGEDNADFVPIAVVEFQDLASAERLVGEQLRVFRLRGPSGRITEWMVGVQPEQVIRIALRTLEECGVKFRSLCKV